MNLEIAKNDKDLRLIAKKAIQFNRDLRERTFLALLKSDRMGSFLKYNKDRMVGCVVLAKIQNMMSIEFAWTTSECPAPEVSEFIDLIAKKSDIKKIVLNSNRCPTLAREKGFKKICTVFEKEVI